MARECIWCGEIAPVVKLRSQGKRGTRMWCCSACRGPIGWIWKRLYGDKLETPVVAAPSNATPESGGLRKLYKPKSTHRQGKKSRKHG